MWNRKLASLIWTALLLAGLCGAATAQRFSCRTVVLYADSGYRGHSIDAENSIADLHSRGMGDSASSICIPAGWRVILYEDTDYRGDSAELTGPESISDLGRHRLRGRSWGDRISSIRVEAPRYNPPGRPTYPSGQGRPGGYDPGRGNQDGFPNQCDQYPMLFSNDDFGGRSIRLDNPIDDMDRIGFNDDASSVCVPRGWTVTLYEHDHYRGDALRLDGEQAISDLKRQRPQGQDWGDRVSSARVERIRYDQPSEPPRECDRSPMLFGDDGYRGRSLVLQSSINDLHRRGFGDDASSVCVPRGWTVILYEDTGFRGASLRLRSGESIADLKRQRPGGRDWGDCVSSVEVIRGRGRR